MMPMTWMLVVLLSKNFADSLHIDEDDANDLDVGRQLLSKNFADSLHIDEDDANDLDVGRRATTASWRRM